MTQFTPPPAPSEIEAFIGQVVTDLSAAFSGVLVNVGRKLGLYQAMAELGACTSAALSEATGIRERYVREWLANQAAGGYVVHNSGNQTYVLPPAQAMVLALEQSPVFMAPAFEVAASFWLDEDKIVETFRSGEGLGWHAHNHRLFCGTESFFRTGYRANLVSAWLPALDGVVERLTRGARVADMGCGHGASTILMAQAFPKSSFLGLDYHKASIETARQRAAEQTHRRLRGDHRYHQPGGQGGKKLDMGREGENPGSVFRDNHVFAQELKQIEVRLPDARAAAVLEFGLPVSDHTAEQRRQQQEQRRLCKGGWQVEIHRANSNSNSSVIKM